MPLLIEIPDELAAQLRALATARNEDINRYAVAALVDHALHAVETIEEGSPEEDEAIEAALQGTFHPFDAARAKERARALRERFDAAK